MSKSEVAQLREKIELEIQAMRRVFDGYAVVSRHDVINHKYDQIGEYVDQLQLHMDKEEALLLLVKALDQCGDGPRDFCSLDVLQADLESISASAVSSDSSIRDTTEEV